MKAFRDWFDTAPDGDYRRYSERPMWHRAAMKTGAWMDRLVGATRHAYHEWRGWMEWGYDERRNLALRAKAKRCGPRDLPPVVWVRIVDHRAECDQDPRLSGQEYWAETNLWGGGVSSSDPISAIQQTVEMAMRMIAEGDDMMPDGRLTITLDANPIAPAE